MNRPTVSSTVSPGKLSRRATATSAVTHGKLNRWESGRLSRESTVQLTAQVVTHLVFEPFRLFLQEVDQLDHTASKRLTPRTSIRRVARPSQKTKTSKGFRSLAC